MSSFVGDVFIMPLAGVPALRTGVIDLLVWLCRPCHWSVGQFSVTLGFLVVSEVLVDLCTQFVLFGVVAWEEFDVPVHVG